MLSLCLLLALSTQQTVPTLELSCGGCSFDRPLQGMRPASARVSFPGDAAEQPAWVRLDRADKQEDKDDSFYNNWWPRWAKTTDGSFSFMWLHATPGTGKPRQREALTVVASGWSHRFNGTRLTANSSNASLWFSFAYWSSSSLLEVEDAGPGAVVLRGKPGEGVNETVADRAHWADNCKFEAYTLDTSDKYKPGLNFKPNSGYIQVSGKCEIRLSFTKPGVWFYGVHGGRHGIGQQAPIPYRYPTAIVIPFRNRTHPPLPQGFAGPIHVTKPLMTSRQFSIIHESVTVFSSAQIQLPITVDMKQHAPSIPKFATILAPTWLAVRPKHNDTMDTDEGASLNSSKSIPAGGGPTAGNGEPRLQQTFFSMQWEQDNNYVRFYLMFAERHVGKTVPLHMLLHDSPDELQAVASDPALWQTLQLELVATPDLRSVLGTGNTKLVTSITWGSAGLVWNGTAEHGDYSFLETYKRLGFNTVPGHAYIQGIQGIHNGVLDKKFAFAANRTAAAGWSGLQYGPELSGFRREFNFAKLPLNASLLPRQFVADEAEEMLKWERAKNFTLFDKLIGGRVDLAYDGAFLKADIADFCAAVNASRPEIIFLDDESFPAFEGWKLACCSANAEARRLKGETNFDLSWRMAFELLKLWSACLDDLPTASGGRTMIGFYGGPPTASWAFPPKMMQSAGFVGMPSVYEQIKELRYFAHGIQDYRREMVAVEDDGLGPAGQLTAKRQLLPWLTSDTYGQMTSADTFSGALHSFAGGASGFAFFGGEAAAGLDDPGKLLALSTAAALAAPYEDLFFRGSSISAPDQLAWNESRDNVLAAAGMQLNGSGWLVVTPVKVGASATLMLTLSWARGARKLYTCELLSGLASTLNVGVSGTAVIETPASAASTMVMHVTATATACKATELWWPRAGVDASTVLTSPTSDIDFYGDDMSVPRHPRKTDDEGSSRQGALGRTVLGYHTCGWGGSNSRSGGWQNYNWSLLTHISYHSAVKLRSNGSLWFQPACGCVSSDCGLPAPDAEFAAIRGAARTHGVKLLLSLTELNATSFAETFLFDPAARAAAVHNLVQLRLDSGAAGFGFDFEGSYITNTTAAAAIVSFFAEVRIAGAAQEEPLILLFPMGAMLDPPLEAAAWNMSALAETVDLIALMCYDFIGGWAGVAGPNAPLTGGMEITDGRPGHFHDWKGDTKAAVSYYQQFSGKVAQEKLLVGVPWYGHEWATNGSGTSRADRTMRSKQIVDSPGANDSRHRAAKYGRVWDATTHTPFYAYRKEWGGSVGWVQGFYDDEQSLALKYDFIRSVPRAGVAIWAINWGFATEPMWRTLAQSGLKSDDDVSPAGTGHVKYMTYYGCVPAEQHAHANLCISTSDATLIEAHSFGMHGMKTIDFLLFRSAIVPRHGLMLRQDYLAIWNDLWTGGLQAMSANKTVMGVFLGDELLAAGVNVTELTLIANAVKASWSAAIVYWNEEWAPVVDNSTYMPRSSALNIMPANIDWLSLDFYRNTPQAWQDPETAYQAAVYSKMAAHQRALQVPQAFGRTNDLCEPVCYANTSQIGCCHNNHGPGSGQWNHSRDWWDRWSATVAEHYFAWAQRDPRIIGINPWYYGADRSDRGCGGNNISVRQQPKARATWERIGKEIIGRLKTDDVPAACEAHERATPARGWTTNL